MLTIRSYGSIFNIGHKAINEIFLDDVVVEEKIDGSQFSFYRTGDQVFCRSKGTEINVKAPEKMFSKAVEWVVNNKLTLKEGYTYRGEYLRNEKHNSIKYDRTPKNNIIIFDIDTDEQNYLTHQEKCAEAERLGLETVPLIFSGKIETLEKLKSMINRTSILGDVKIEGVVVKNYGRFGREKKILMGKFVSEEFKELHDKEWGKTSPAKVDVLEEIISSLNNEAIWKKAVQHMRDDGKIAGKVTDIGPLMRELSVDIKKETTDFVAKKLTEWAMPKVIRAVSNGFPQWYKKILLETGTNLNEQRLD